MMGWDGGDGWWVLMWVWMAALWLLMLAVVVWFVGASCANRGQNTPNGFYNIERMLNGITNHIGEVGVCGTCMDARGIAEPQLVEGAHRSTMDELADWTMGADRVVTF